MYATFSALRKVHLELEQRKEDVLGCLRFIASRPCADGVVLLDQLIVWENIDVALAVNAEDYSANSPRRSPILRWFGVRAYR